MRMLVLALLLFACKLGVSSTELYDAEVGHAVRLNVTPEGLSISQTNGNSLDHAFYYAHVVYPDFSAATVQNKLLYTHPIVFSRLVFAWRRSPGTWLCFLTDVDGNKEIMPARETSCYRQRTSNDYLHKFVEWCLQDNRVGSPFNAAGDCSVGKVTASNSISIPSACFTGNACFPRKGYNKPRTSLGGGRNKQHQRDDRGEQGKYFLDEHLQKNFGGDIDAMLDDLYAQVKDCKQVHGLINVRMDNDFGFFCRCPQAYGKIKLNGKERKCDQNFRYNFFPRP